MIIQKRKLFKIINYSRTEKKDISQTTMLPGSDYIIYYLNNKNIKLVKYFSTSKSYYIKIQKNQKYYFLAQEQCMGHVFKKIQRKRSY